MIKRIYNKINKTQILGRHLRMPRPLPGCSKTLKCLYEALQCFQNLCIYEFIHWSAS